jgi:Fe-S cluster biogenesis protein NfuA
VITVTQDGHGDWPVLEFEIIEAIKTFLPSHDPEFKTDEAVVDQSNWSDERRKLEDVIDRDIRPGLQADGGDLVVLDFIDNIVTVKYEGACGSCPSSRTGTLSGIESILRHEVHPEIQIVTID